MIHIFQLRICELAVLFPVIEQRHDDVLVSRRNLLLQFFWSAIPKMRLFYIKSEDGFQCHGVLVARLYLELMEDAGVFIVCLKELADGFIFQEKPCIYFLLQHIFQLSLQRNRVGKLVIEGYIFSIERQKTRSRFCGTP